jgi:FAD-dependent urate hydroxylase
VVRIEPGREGFLRLALKGTAEPEAFARKVVLGTGREGMGEPFVPNFVKDLPRERFTRPIRSIFPCCMGVGWW